MIAVARSFSPGGNGLISQASTLWPNTPAMVYMQKGSQQQREVVYCLWRLPQRGAPRQLPSSDRQNSVCSRDLTPYTPIKQQEKAP